MQASLLSLIRPLAAVWTLVLLLGLVALTPPVHAASGASLPTYFYPVLQIPRIDVQGYGSVTLNCFANTRNVDLDALNQILKTKHGLVIDGGYGKLKGKTFRISNMGDETDQTIAAMLAAFDAALAETPKAPAA